MTPLSLQSTPDTTRQWRLLFLLSLAVFTVLMLFRLTEFPAYFFCDEAIQGVEAESLISTGKDTYEQGWPLIFRGYGSYHLSLSVYFHIPVQLLLGKSVFAVRSVGVLAGVFSVLAMTMLLRQLRGGRQFTSLTPLLVLVSAFFFVHFRTGFEIVISLSAWVWFVFLFDRVFGAEKRAGILMVPLLAIIAAISFYCYTPARGWIALTVPVMFLAYLRAAFRHWRATLFFGMFLALFLSPYVYAINNNPEMAFGRLQALGFSLKSGLSEELINNALRYLRAVMDPRYWAWFTEPPHFESWQRHVIPGRSLLPLWIVIFLPIGLCSLIYQSRRSPLARALVLLLPVGAFPAVLFTINPLRCAPVGTLYFLISLHGMYLTAGAVFERLHFLWRAQAIATFLLAAYAIFFVRTVFVHDRYHYVYYDFYGLQTGAPEVFDWIARHQHMGERIILSSSSFNENVVLSRFYFGKDWKNFVSDGEIAPPCVLAKPAHSGLWIVRDSDYQAFLGATCDVMATEVEDIIGYTGKPIFKVVRFQSTITQEEWEAREEARRRTPVHESVSIDGQLISVERPQLDYGQIADIFDGKENTVARSDMVRPFMLRMSGFNGRMIRGISLMATNCENGRVKINAHLTGGESVSKELDSTGTREMCPFNLKFPHPIALAEIEISLDVLNAGDNRVHLGELTFENANPG